MNYLSPPALAIPIALNVALNTIAWKDYKEFYFHFNEAHHQKNRRAKATQETYQISLIPNYLAAINLDAFCSIPLTISCKNGTLLAITLERAPDPLPDLPIKLAVSQLGLERLGRHCTSNVLIFRIHTPIGP